MYKYSIVFVIPVVFLLTSCAGLPYIDQALVLKGYSDEREAQAVDVARCDELFEKLLDKVNSGEAQRFTKTVTQLVDHFGEPLLKRAMGTPKGDEEWLYRHQIQSASSFKVYVIVAAGGVIKEFRVEQ